MAKQPQTPPQRPASKTPAQILKEYPGTVKVPSEFMAPSVPPKEPEPLCVTMSCRTCVWHSSGGRCHRYPPTVITPQKDAADFPLLRPGFWCGEHKAR
jgi:hypothetical protein